jgi:hypothetical protein
MSEERTSPHNIENDESGLLLSVEPTSERSMDYTALSDDTDNVDADAEDTADTDTEDNVGDTDGTDAADTDTTDDADGTD